jgi:DNA-directed RNA polymerase specialized sigma subunit
MEIQQKEILEKYCNNEMAKLKAMCNPMLNKIGGLYRMDMDDFYSIALGVLTDSVFRYDENNKCSFDCFLASNIKRKFKTEIRDRNRLKKIPQKNIESMNALIGEDGMEISEMIPSDFDTFEIAAQSMMGGTRIQRYLNQLSHTQRKIVALLSEGYKPMEIREYLHMSAKVYSNNIQAIQSYENTRVLTQRY